MSKKLTGDVGAVATRLDLNTRGVAKIVSGWRYLRNGGVPEYGAPEIFDRALNALLDERMKLRDQLEEYLRNRRGR
jgi:hypothetical protein